MICETFKYESEAGCWSCPSFPQLDSDHTLVVIFGAPRLKELEERIREVREAYPRALLMGCSSAGEIYQTEINDESLSVAVMRFEHTRLKMASSDSESVDAGLKLAKDLKADDLKFVFVLSDGLNVNGTTLSHVFKQALPSDVIITGGLAGDGSEFERTWVIDADQPVSNRVVAVGFYGENIHIDFGSEGGWDPFGPERCVTRSEGNLLYELDGKPALDVYKRYLGNLAEELPGSALLFPLSIRHEEDEPSQGIVRTILSVDQEENTMTFAGDIPEGAIVQLMRCNMDRVIDGAGQASQAISPRSDGDILSLAISCVGRRLVLKHRAEEEVESVLGNLPENTRQVGFYSYGEISPMGLLNCELHNQTMTVTVISES